MKKISISIFLYFSILLNADIVDITADHFHADDITKVAYFEGNARIKQGKNKFLSSKIVVHFNKKRKATKYEALGNVEFDLTESGIHYVGSAQKITYSPNNSKYYFSGDVILKDLTNNRKISAQRISLDLKTGLADIKGAKKKPVHFIFEIEDRK
ncbi:OstA family organic solvent tolerance protein [hydrothermal vent metagenome]|uniref:OstA family organic solvent tolerance protein n=1 Tax=hydrothermal vent metagenome TaxID=652676 RepID=A0A1W1CP67_9ZZZZ